VNLSPERLEQLEQLGKRLGLPNIDPLLLHEALCHSSYANEQTDLANYGNERLEFLGDSVVGFVITEALFLRYPHLREGDLSKIKSIVVSKRILAERTESLGLSTYLLLGRGEERTGGRKRFSILGNLFESIVGAIYLSEGMEVAKEFVLDQLSDEVERASVGESLVDYKSTLQERVQQGYGVLPTYRLVGSVGPDHDKEFTVEVYIGGNLLSEGTGKSKKRAEKSAAANALLKLDEMEQNHQLPEGPESEETTAKSRARKRASVIPSKGRLLAIDPGEKRIGVALSDKARVISQPYTTIENTNATTVTKEIAKLVLEQQITAVIVGLPRGLDGRETASTSSARKLGDRLRKILGVPVVMWDERLSTAASERHLIDTGMRREERRERMDQYAAAWILEGYMEHLKQIS